MFAKLIFLAHRLLVLLVVVVIVVIDSAASVVNSPERVFLQLRHHTGATLQGAQRRCICVFHHFKIAKRTHHLPLRCTHPSWRVLAAVVRHCHQILLLLNGSTHRRLKLFMLLAWSIQKDEANFMVSGTTATSKNGLILPQETHILLTDCTLCHNTNTLPSGRHFHMCTPTTSKRSFAFRSSL